MQHWDDLIRDLLLRRVLRRVDQHDRAGVLIQPVPQRVARGFASTDPRRLA
uniref:Uncharacterized protein n=1 Tax=uncultured marine virus TaxID=186617 RepID=A0A0F7L6U7_9VIRU|nr:hypothetical protein [uncultured marine virus]